MIQIFSVFSLGLTFIMSILVIISVKSKINQELRKCLDVTTKLNRNRKNTLEHLFSLNPKAKLLRTKRTVAERAYRAAPTPSTRAAAFSALQAVKLLQKIFHSHQKILLIKLKGLNTAFKTKLLLQKSKVIELSNKSLVKAYPKNSASPSYKSASEFSKISRVFIRKKFELVSDIPTLYSILLNNRNGFIECGSVAKISKMKKIRINLLGGKSF